MTIDEVIEHLMPRIRYAVGTWLRVLAESKYGEPGGADVDHSALLRRLLGGHEPLAKPPPRRHSYPCYDLGEGRKVAGVTVHEREDGIVVIDQDAGYRWEKRQPGGKAGILIYVPTGDHYRLTREPMEMLWNIGGQFEVVLQYALHLQKVRDVAKEGGV